jgi:2-dehydropantoate 2-reductase
MERAEPFDEVAHVQVTSQDGRFKTSLPRDVMEEALILYSIDGEPVPEHEGGPFRLLIPNGPDPCANVKQVGRIDLLAEPGQNVCGHKPGEHQRG